MTEEDPFIEPEILAAANRRHDAEHHNVCMDDKVRLRSRWLTDNMVGDQLTDRKINQYAKRGMYSEEFRQARRAMWKKRSAKSALRQGNFVSVEGRLIYNPS